MSRRVVRVAVLALVAPLAVTTAVPQAATMSFPAGAEARHAASGTLGGTAAVTPAASTTSLPDAVAATPSAARELVTGDVPRPALRAYRAAESALRIVDPACRLSWDVLAAIGGLESDHGRRHSGRLGPMRMVSSVWRTVGVDGDVDGERDPRDIDDAAPAAATYLCAGEENLATERGLQAALLRYNRSPEYADLAMRVAAGYEQRVQHLPPLAAVALGPEGSGVEVGLGTPGRGVLIGGSDDVSDHEDDGSSGHASRHGENRGDDRGAKGRHGAEEPGRRGHRDDKPGSGRGENERGNAGVSKGGKQGQGQGEGQGHRNGHSADSGGSGTRPQPPRPTHPPKPDHRPGSGQDRPKPPRPTPSKPPRPGTGSGSGRTDQPAVSQYSGRLLARGAGHYLAIDGASTYRLADWQPEYEAFLDQEVVVTGRLRGSTLEVSAIAPAGA